MVALTTFFLVVCEFRKLQFFCVCLNVPFEHLGGGMLLQLLAQICIYLIYRRRQPFCLNDAFNDYALAFGLRMQAFICM